METLFILITYVYGMDVHFTGNRGQKPEQSDNIWKQEIYTSQVLYDTDDVFISDLFLSWPN